MKLASHFAQSIADSGRQEDSASWALCSYLKSWGNQQILDDKLLNHFLLDALRYPQWQSRRSELQTDLLKLISDYQSAGFGKHISLGEILDISRLQLIQIQDAGELYKIVKSFESKNRQEAESIRVLPDGEERMMVLALNARHELTVKNYGQMAYIKNGALIPLPPEQQLQYGPELDLKGSLVHWIRLNGLTTVRFGVSSAGLKGVAVAGARFKPVETFTAPSLASESRIFFAVKRLERFYVYRNSDPYYLELIENLERSIEHVRIGASLHEDLAQKVFEQGQMAFENIFPDDKALFHLLRELTTLLTLKRQRVLPMHSL